MLIIPITKNKALYFSFILLGIYCLLPFLLLAFYAHPQADDYPFGLRDKQLSFWDAQVVTYNNWSGRYFSTAIMRINPLAIDITDTYPIYVLAIILALAASILLLLYHVLRPHLRVYEILGMVYLFLALYLMQLPSTAEGLFWLTGFLGYTLPNVMFLILLLLLYKVTRTQKKCAKISLTVVATFIGVLIAGANEMAMLYMMTTLLFILTVSWRYFSPNRFHFLAVFALCLAASLAAILAPGNFNRMELHPQAEQSFWSVSYAGLLTISTFYKWGGLLLLLALMYVYVFGAKVNSIPELSTLFKVPLPWLLLYIVGTIFLMNFLFVWATGERPTPRLQNVIYFYLLISCFYAVQVLFNQKVYWFRVNSLPKFLSCAVMALGFLTLLDINNNISTAYLDLLSGKATQYKVELRQRDMKVSLLSCRQCIVQPLTRIPVSLYFQSLQTTENEAEQWINREYALYWGKESVVISSPNAPIQDNYTTLVEVGKKWRDRLFY